MVSVHIAFNAPDVKNARFILECIARDIEAGNELGEGWYLDNSDERTEDYELMSALMEEAGGGRSDV